MGGRGGRAVTEFWGAHREEDAATLSSCGPCSPDLHLPGRPWGRGSRQKGRAHRCMCWELEQGLLESPGQGARTQLPGGRGNETVIGLGGPFPCQTPARLPRVTHYCERLPSGLGVGPHSGQSPGFGANGLTLIPAPPASVSRGQRLQSMVVPASGGCCEAIGIRYTKYPVAGVTLPPGWPHPTSASAFLPPRCPKNGPGVGGLQVTELHSGTHAAVCPLDPPGGLSVLKALNSDPCLLLTV